MLDQLDTLSVMPFFLIKTPVLFSSKNAKGWQKKCLLPSFSHFLDEKEQTKVSMSWNYEGLYFFFDSKKEIESIELFIDTRDIKTKSYMTRFCHHFIFYPITNKPAFGKEITRFRGEDTHSLCHREDLEISLDKSVKKPKINIEILAKSLFGYDPARFDRLGFTYRIKYPEYQEQNFCLSSDEYVIEQNPSFWGTLQLKEKE